MIRPTFFGVVIAVLMIIGALLGVTGCSQIAPTGNQSQVAAPVLTDGGIPEQ